MKLRQTVLVLVLAWPVCGLADFQKGIAALGRGDYDIAAGEFRPLAGRGDAAAQFNLGFMYDHGLGFPQDDVEAMKWYRLAAEQGNTDAQFNLGFLYGEGRGVAQDDANAYAWYNLAAAQGDELAKSFRDHLRKIMTPDQLIEAQKLSRELIDRISKVKE
jgi:hypothetical protein